jgi:hypothetical protein
MKQPPLPFFVARERVTRPSLWWDQCRGCGEWFPPTVTALNRHYHAVKCRGAVEVPS